MNKPAESKELWNFRCSCCGKLLAKINIVNGTIQIKCTGVFRGEKCNTLNTFFKEPPQKSITVKR
jgi:phage FluMu protein Com